MTFDDLDADFAAALVGGKGRVAPITPEEFAALAAPEVPSGFTTLTLTDGSRKRFRIRLEKGAFLRGKRTLSRYCKLEADDAAEREWETVATLESDGFALFKRWRGSWEERWAKAIWALLHNLPAPGYELQFDRRCRYCLRAIAKDPLSQQHEMGPGCRKKMGVG